MAAIRKAWSSLFVARAMSYRLRQRQHYRDTPMAVGVLRLVHARCAGVGFSADPVRKKLDRFIVEGSWGWGEAVVQGTVEPDHVEIDRADGRVISYRVGNKRIATVFDRALGVVADKELPVRFHAARCLSEEMINALWQALTQIERHFGHPVDIEWVIEPNWRPGIPVSVVQVRAITTLGNEAPASAPPKWDALGYAAKYGLGIKPKRRSVPEEALLATLKRLKIVCRRWRQFSPSFCDAVSSEGLSSHTMLAGLSDAPANSFGGLRFFCTAKSVRFTSSSLRRLTTQIAATFVQNEAHWPRHSTQSNPSHLFIFANRGGVERRHAAGNAREPGGVR